MDENHYQIKGLNMETAQSGMAAIIAETEAALTKENDTTPATTEDTISAGDGEDTIASAGEDTIPGSEGDTIEAGGSDTLESGNKEPDKKKPWFMNKIDRETDKRRKAEDAALKLREENEALKKLANVTEPEKDVKEQIRQEVRKELELEKTIAHFNEKCDLTAAKGKEKYTDFEDAVGTLHAVGLATNQFLDVVTDLKASDEILYHLGKNPEEAERLLNLPAAKLGAELGRLEAKFTKPVVKQQVSKAPPPVKVPAGGGAGAAYTGDDPEKLLSSEDGIAKYFDKKFNRK